MDVLNKSISLSKFFATITLSDHNVIYIFSPVKTNQIELNGRKFIIIFNWTSKERTSFGVELNLKNLFWFTSL